MCTSVGGTRSFVVDVGVVRASVVARVVCAAPCLDRCPWFFPPQCCQRFLSFPNERQELRCRGPIGGPLVPDPLRAQTFPQLASGAPVVAHSVM